MTRPKDEQPQALVAGLEGPRDRRGNAYRIERRDLDDLVVELQPSGPFEHDVDLLRVLVAVGEGLTLAGFDYVEGEADRIRFEVLPREACLLYLREAELGRHVLDLAQVLDRVAHAASLPPRPPGYSGGRRPWAADSESIVEKSIVRPYRA